MSLVRNSLLRTRVNVAPRITCLRFSSTSTEPIVLPRLQSDLKNAMRSKNKPTLNVIRALQAEIINASKTAKPITTDGALYSLIQKQIKSSTTAIQEFEAAKRDDLVQKEQEQVDILKKYADEIPKVEESEIDGLISAAVEKLEEGKRTFGSVMGRVMGGIKGRPADMEYLNKKIEEAIGKK
ncbi:Yqey-like protein-domain-containing protein [Paraphoma chrysanthemicola]|uniref:Altered inheritance of mitochondria protein 41 n=1 Tax=Paraphoma chrysanthemicola TaxID=798071 RepID=A0A8K0VSY3_9PLEO|nr:Yqey-like protein-domain-containing protein [Paraphoma chrysanthemicola]